MKRSESTTHLRLLEFFGSMNLAITLLVAIAIASIIGTVLQQNQPYTDYVIKFGPFWFAFFKNLGLFNIYGSLWFLLLLGALLLSTAVCVYRNTPSLLRDIYHYRSDAREKSLRAFKHHSQWPLARPQGELLGLAAEFLQQRGYRFKSHHDAGGTTLAAMKGRSSRFGYIFTHIGIVVICLGGLVDGNLPLKWAVMQDEIVPEVRELPLSEVPAKSTLEVGSSAFRGSVTIPEGSSTEAVFIGLRDGYLVQPLPFTIALDDFRIEHYPSGAPKSFESDVVILDPESAEPLRRTIAVNHPLSYQGYNIFQSSFSDGGSTLRMRLWSLTEPQRKPRELEGRINQTLELSTPEGEYRLELIDFRLFNIFPNEDPQGDGKRFRNYGPSMQFRLRNASGEATEFRNYMSPVTIDGRPYFVSGMRKGASESYRYIHIPVDRDGSIKTFMQIGAMIRDPKQVAAAITQQLDGLEDAGLEPGMRTELQESIATNLKLFADQGLDAMAGQMEARLGDPSKVQGAMEVALRVVQNTIGILYLELLTKQGFDSTNGFAQGQEHYFEDLFKALSLVGPYSSPLLLKLDSFEHRQASGLQITRSPGKSTVYLGCLLLMVGIFLMLYLHHRRLWLRIGADGNVLLAASGHRNRTDISGEFSELRRGLMILSGAADLPGDETPAAARHP